MFVKERGFFNCEVPYYGKRNIDGTVDNVVRKLNELFVEKRRPRGKGSWDFLAASRRVDHSINQDFPKLQPKPLLLYVIDI